MTEGEASPSPKGANRAFFDAPSEIFLFSRTFLLRIAPELFVEINVLDGQQTELHVVIKVLGVYHFRTMKCAVFQRSAVVGTKVTNGHRSENILRHIEESNDCFQTVPAYGCFDGGSNTPSFPYRLCNAESCHCREIRFHA